MATKSTNRTLLTVGIVGGGVFLAYKFLPGFLKSVKAASSGSSGSGIGPSYIPPYENYDQPENPQSGGGLQFSFGGGNNPGGSKSAYASNAQDWDTGKGPTTVGSPGLISDVEEAYDNPGLSAQQIPYASLESFTPTAMPISEAQAWAESTQTPQNSPSKMQSDFWDWWDGLFVGSTPSGMPDASIISADAAQQYDSVLDYDMINAQANMANATYDAESYANLDNPYAIDNLYQSYDPGQIDSGGAGGFADENGNS